MPEGEIDFKLINEAFAVLSDATAVNPTFVTDAPGAYVLDLVVNDGFVSSPADSVTVSSDSGGFVPCFNERGEMTRMGVGAADTMLQFTRELVSRGHGLADILPAMTSNVADLLKLRTKGRIAVGMDADLVCLDDHFKAQHVMAGGQWMVRSGQPIIKGTFE